ncbi:hypothetical protein SAMN04515674_12411 [Pseudarcicella hirudinis]|uniref:Uncharacterized protein n=1 Tax=Pseudarcicella hirudinis TaxID=1079859 RepID=A0A1I5Z341_9BACT|nr:hypothetical protein SAMN04515674_12411 [Pseudarcicella hirudinis]
MVDLKQIFYGKEFVLNLIKDKVKALPGNPEVLFCGKGFSKTDSEM